MYKRFDVKKGIVQDDAFAKVLLFIAVYGATCMTKKISPLACSFKLCVSEGVCAAFSVGENASCSVLPFLS